MNKTIRTKQFNVRFKTLLKKLMLKYNDNKKFVNKLDLLCEQMKSNTSRTIIYLFNDYIISNPLILKNIVKSPSDENIEFFSSMNGSTVSKSLDNNIIFSDIKGIFNVAEESIKKEVLMELYNLKNIVNDFNNVGE
jgi:hypothetical protein